MAVLIHSPCYLLNDDGSLSNLCTDENTNNNPFITDRELAVMVSSLNAAECPAVMLEDNIAFGKVANEEHRVIFGPVQMGHNDTASVIRFAERHNIHEPAGFIVNCCEPKEFGAGLLMLYHALTGRTISLTQLLEINSLNHLDVFHARRNVVDVIFERQEFMIEHNPYSEEVREMESIRRGEVDMLKKCIAETYSGKLGRLADNETRQAQNIAIVVITLASRAAIEGGMLPEKSFSMVDGYVQKVEKMTNPMAIEAIMRRAEYDFAEHVRDLNKGREKNYLVERAKTLIFIRLHEELKMSEIAEALGVSQAYLSALFTRSEGMTMQQYASREKIHQAKQLLCYSKYELKEIAAILAFSSQSHFGKVFKQETGLSPSEWRKKFGRIDEQCEGR